MIKVGIIGANGYLGIELIRILYMHPNVKLSKIFQRELPIDEEFPHLQSLNLKDIQTENLDDFKIMTPEEIYNDRKNKFQFSDNRRLNWWLPHNSTFLYSESQQTMVGPQQAIHFIPVIWSDGQFEGQSCHLVIAIQTCHLV